MALLSRKDKLNLNEIFEHCVYLRKVPHGSVVGAAKFHNLGTLARNVGPGGPHHRCLELIASSSFNKPTAVERE